MYHAPTSAARHPQQPAEDTRLHGRSLLLARAGWLVIVTATLALFVGGLPAFYALLQAPCVGTLACESGGPMTAAGVEALQAAGFSLNDYATFILALTLAVSLVWVLVGLVIFWRRSDDWVALLGSCALIIYYTGENGTINLSLPAWSVPVGMIAFLSEAAITFFVALFPSGRFVPRWIFWVMPIHLLQTALSIFPPLDSPFNTNNWSLAANILSIGFLGAAIFAQIYRYRRVSNAVQRQQTKWVVFGVSISLVLLIGVLLAGTLLASGQSGMLAQVAINTAWSLCLLPIPISIGIAMVRSRLWDIDTIINKALVYGSLTALLGALYAGLIIGLQALANLFTRLDQSPIVLVISTLAIAALFQPARRRLQNLIDRRFYRQKYDAEKALAAFNASLRSEVDLEQVRAQLLAVVQETMQPAHVSLWLRQPERQPADLAPTLEQPEARL